MLLLAAGFAVYSFSPRFRNMIMLATTHQPQQYVELFFTTPDDLPKKVAENNQQIMVKFTILDRENNDTRKKYSYEVVAESDDQDIVKEV